jgi:glycosyltransferase involved in cell wall biosynthesis
MIAPLRDGFERVAARIAAAEPLTIALVNDVGFVGGAGAALRRQAQSFLLDGHRVGVICGLAQSDAPPSGPGRDLAAGWLGLRAIEEAARDATAARSLVVEAVDALGPDLVVSGNFHWFRWPVAILGDLAERGRAVVAYLHDMHWISGRCAYSGTCRRFVDGCDAACPTPAEYPPLDPDRIADAWRERRRVFVARGVPLAANSAWMAARACEGFGGAASVSLLPLALDERRFAPIDRGVARRLLALPEDAPTVLVGAVDVSERRKGGHLLRAVVPDLAAAGATVLAFGHNSQYLPGVRGLGYIGDERLMPVILSASDVFLNVSLEESFGQTLMEAAACAVPSVAIARGGVPEIARHGENALLVEDEDPARLVQATLSLLRDAARRAELGRAGRRLVERDFSLPAQARRWREYLRSPIA